MPTPHGFVEKLAELSASGAPFVSVTLVETVGSTPQDAGTKMLVNTTGLLFGTVGGGRVEHHAIEHARDMLAQQDGRSSLLVEWNLQRDVGMTCGGSVKLFFEVYNLHEWRIVIFGAGHVAQALVRVLLQLECQIVCIDPREQWLSRLPDSRRLAVLHMESMPEYVSHLRESDYVLSLTMGHRTDRPILQEIFRQSRQFPYLGVIGSAAKRKVLVRELTEAGISADTIEPLRCPLGLNLGSNQPGEIAVSIVAELIATRDRQPVEV